LVARNLPGSVLGTSYLEREADMQVLEHMRLEGGKVAATIFEAATSKDPDRVRLVVECGGSKVSRFYGGEQSLSDAIREADDYAHKLVR
jgi:hypothetical protein